MNENADMDYYSDNEVNRKTHSRLLDEVLQLDKCQYVKKPSRTEPSTHVSEFTLVKPSAGRRNTINIGDLTKSLKQKSKHVIISNKVKSATAKAKTLRKPLEKPQAEKIRRSIGFQKTKSELNKWNSVVDKNRVAAQLVFPLNQGEIDFKVLHSKNIEFRKRYKSELDIELEKLEPQPEPAVEEDQFPLSIEELVQKRQEMARLRAHQSYQEAKAYKRNKIKSKMFHRIQRKERIKQQIKEFEELKKTDPEEALRKLEQLEKTRAEERMSLRHRSTGQWAKNKQIRAKYDKESRQAISQQLTISRELTEKRALHMDSDSDSDDHINADNLPKVNIDQTTDVNEFVSGYRKFWNEQNKNESQPNQITTSTFAADEFSDSETEYAPYDDKKTNGTENGRQLKQVKKESGQLTDNQTKDIVSKCNVLKDKRKKKKSIQRKESFCNNQWTVTPVKDEIMKAASDTLVENMFDNLEYDTLNKINTKIDKLKNVPVPKKQKLSFITGQLNEKQSEFPREKLRPVVDDELTNADVDNLYPKNKLESSDSGFWSLSNAEETEADTGKTMIDSSVNIDPNDFLTVKETILDTKLPTIATGDDNSDSDNDQRAFIAEAFKDDDLMEEFSKEKQDVIDKDKPKDVDLTLPGWGAWGGKGVKVSKRKRNRFIVKAPSEVPRRDDNKGTLIINEHKDAKVRKHQVSEVPFPFKTVKDYEASIRAPIGDTFVPQTAFRRLIKPSLVTKKGAIIEPMSKDALLNQKFTQNGRLVKR